jgi:hypothetical protein
VDEARTGSVDANQLPARRREGHERDVILVKALRVLALPLQDTHHSKRHVPDAHDGADRIGIGE